MTGLGSEVLLFIMGMVFLVWGSSLFVDSAVRIAKHFHVPEVLIGATIVSLGTTLPEVLFSVTASFKGLPDMALGNALGSILCNTGMIAGILLLLRPMEIKKGERQNLIWNAGILSAAFLIYAVSGFLFGGLTGVSGLVLLGLCIYYLWNIKKRMTKQEETFLEEPFQTSDWIRVVMEAVLIYIGASVLVDIGPQLAHRLGVPEVVIALVFVAVGTSLPELITSLIAIKKRHAALSLGNITGADILNFVLVGGLSSLIHPIHYPDTVMRLDLPFVALVLVTLCLPAVLKKKTARGQGVLLVLFYIGYLLVLNRDYIL